MPESWSVKGFVSEACVRNSKKYKWQHFAVWWWVFFWREILDREAREGGIQILLLLRELFSCRNYSSFESSPSGSKSGETFFNNFFKNTSLCRAHRPKFFLNFHKVLHIFWVTTEGYWNPVAEQSGCCHVGICIRHHTDTCKVHRECLVSCNGLAVGLPCNFCLFVCCF